MKPRISIIMPVWNGLPFLRQAVESVVDQELADWELLIRDDGSSDGSLKYLSDLTDPRIKVFAQGDNLGIFGNLNFLFNQARAPISQILCQDDYFTTPSALSEIIACWETMPVEVGFMRCNAIPRDSGRSLKSFGETLMPEIVRPPQADLFFFLFGCIPGNLSNVSLRTGLVAQMGGFRQALPYAGDFEFWSRAARVVAFRRTAATWVYIRAHEGQASSHLNLRGELIPQLYSIVDGLYARLKTPRNQVLLRLYATIGYDAQHRWVGLKHQLRTGDATYLQAVDRNGDRFVVFCQPYLRWILFMLSLRGRVGTVLLATRLVAASRSALGCEEAKI
ncbi:hypothetical protein CSW58_13090 [Caulobacter sp. B11]|uniref:glycosyltransferase family 2 protein n=1 Tax=Caulobacter sp. B11 TaxID=2048899 RepID=UPI000C12B572|nr:glycosyltransferase [Caulobacter sp. B11]PHY12371.1 hypothetical protein CSW58_13090 [Caulobacter sp. B11]